MSHCSDGPTSQGLQSDLWEGSSLGTEDSFHQIAPYVGKMKTSMASALIERYSQPGDVVLDPFAGCGVVPLEALLHGRHAVANDLNPYAYTVTRAKLAGPPSLDEATRRAEAYLTAAESQANLISLDDVPAWVRRFFHPDTLREALTLTALLRAREEWFLLGCLLGILHHVRPGFLSYPASHLTPYLREAKYPRHDYPEMYAYRDVRSRLLAKVRRAYRRHTHPAAHLRRAVLVCDARSLDLPDASIDAVVSSPPYFDALDYGRDNRLRLWFLGVPNYKLLDPMMIASPGRYVEDMGAALREIARVLKPGGCCALVLGEVRRDGRHHRTPELLCHLATNELGLFSYVETIHDEIPDVRRSRRRTHTTKADDVLVLRRV